MFNVVKLIVIPKDFIFSRHIPFLLDLIIINKEKEWKVEKILDIRSIV